MRLISSLLLLLNVKILFHLRSSRSAHLFFYSVSARITQTTQVEPHLHLDRVDEIGEKGFQIFSVLSSNELRLYSLLHFEYNEPFPKSGYIASTNFILSDGSFKFQYKFSSENNIRERLHSKISLLTVPLLPSSYVVPPNVATQLLDSGGRYCVPTLTGLLYG